MRLTVFDAVLSNSSVTAFALVFCKILKSPSVVAANPVIFNGPLVVILTTVAVAQPVGDQSLILPTRDPAIGFMNARFALICVTGTLLRNARDPSPSNA